MKLIEKISLLIPNDKADEFLQNRIEKGNQLKYSWMISEDDYKKVKAEFKKWDKYNIDLLTSIFSNDAFGQEYNDVLPNVCSSPFNLGYETERLKDDIQEKINILESIKERTVFYVKAFDGVTASIESTPEQKKIEKENIEIVIVTALEDEFNALTKLPIEWKPRKKEADGINYIASKIEKDGKIIKLVAACSHQMGMSAASALSMKMINTFNPKYVAMIGIAAGVGKDINFGDILIADQVWDWGAGKIKDDDKGECIFEPGSNHIALDGGLLQNFKKFVNQKRNIIDQIQENLADLGDRQVKLNIHIGPFVSGSAVLASESYVDKLKLQHRHLLGIDMETYGVFCAASFANWPQPKVFCIKSVQDKANVGKSDRFRPYAVRTSAFFLYHFIREELI